MLFVEHDIPVRTYDIDYAGHVSNIAYLRWFEDMRTILFDKYFSLQTFLAEGKAPVITSHYVEYKRAIKLFDKPRARMWISDVGSARLIVTAEIRVEGVVTTTVEHKIVFIDSATGRPIRMPAICSQLFQQSTELMPTS